MIEVARALAAELDNVGIPVFAAERGFTASHRFAVMAAEFGGGQTASKRLRKAGFLASGIGLLVEAVEGDLNGLRIGTPELVRWGVTASDVPQLAALVARALRSDDPEALVPQVADLRTGFDTVHFVS